MADFTNLSDGVASKIANDNAITIEDAQFVWKKSLGFNEILVKKYPLESVDNINIVTKTLKRYQIQLINQIKKSYVNAIVSVDTDSEDEIEKKRIDIIERMGEMEKQIERINEREKKIERIERINENEKKIERNEKKIEQNEKIIEAYEHLEFKKSVLFEFIEDDEGLLKFDEETGFCESKAASLVKEMRINAIQILLFEDDPNITQSEPFTFKVKVKDEDRTYLVYSEAEAKKFGLEKLKESIHLYTSEFLSDVFKIHLPISAINEIKEIGEVEAPAACRALIDDWEEALSRAVSLDGYGSVFHSYDNDCDKIVVETNCCHCEFIIIRID